MRISRDKTIAGLFLVAALGIFVMVRRSWYAALAGISLADMHRLFFSVNPVGHSLSPHNAMQI